MTCRTLRTFSILPSCLPFILLHRRESYLGRGDPVTDLPLGLIRPSSQAGARSLVKARMDFPYSGNKRLLHHPVRVRYLVVWSQGKVCSSQRNTTMKIVHSISLQNRKTSMRSVPQALFSCNICVFLRPVLPLGNLRFIHALTNAIDNHKYSTIPSQILTVLKFWYHLVYSFSRENNPFDFGRAPSASQKAP